MEASHRPTSLELDIAMLLDSPDGKKYTDLHINSNGIVRGRIGANRWENVHAIDGKKYVVRASDVNEFLEAIFRSQEDPLSEPGAKKSWRQRLSQERSLHPSMYIGNIDSVTGVETMQRVRITVQRQSTGSDIGMMIRALRPLPKTPEELGLPLAIDTFAGSNSGLILVVGPTGAGKTTTIASVLQGINNTRDGHIVTIEDPIEYVIEPNRCIVNQREIGIDVASFHDGVKDALRFVPDVIMIGEIRDAETMLAGVRAAESGHLVIASLHAPSTVQGVRKCLGYLSSPAEQLSFANSLVGILAQQLVIGRSGQKHLVFETLNGRSVEVQRSISNVMTDASGKSLDSLEQKLRNKDLISEFCLPMKMCVDALIAEGKITRDVGGAALYNPDDVRAILRQNDAHVQLG